MAGAAHQFVELEPESGDGERYRQPLTSPRGSSWTADPLLWALYRGHPERKAAPLLRQRLLPVLYVGKTAIRTGRVEITHQDAAAAFGELLSEICEEHGVDHAAVKARDPRGTAKFARAHLCYLARTKLDLSANQIGKFLGGRDRQTVGHAITLHCGRLGIDWRTMTGARKRKSDPPHQRMLRTHCTKGHAYEGSYRAGDQCCLICKAATDEKKNAQARQRRLEAREHRRLTVRCECGGQYTELSNGYRRCDDCGTLAVRKARTGEENAIQQHGQGRFVQRSGQEARGE